MNSFSDLRRTVRSRSNNARNAVHEAFDADRVAMGAIDIDEVDIGVVGSVALAISPAGPSPSS